MTFATPSENLNGIHYGDAVALRASTWKLATLGGEQFSDGLVQGLRGLGKPFLQAFNAYGPTETRFCSNVTEVYHNESISTHSSVPAGRTLTNVSVYITDDALNSLLTEASCEIVIGAADLDPPHMWRQHVTRHTLRVQHASFNGRVALTAIAAGCLADQHRCRYRRGQ